MEAISDSNDAGVDDALCKTKWMNECMNERMKALPDINQYQRKLLCCIYGIRYVRGLSIYLHIYILYFIIILYHIISFYCIVIYVYYTLTLGSSNLSEFFLSPLAWFIFVFLLTPKAIICLFFLRAPSSQAKTTSIGSAGKKSSISAVPGFPGGLPNTRPNSHFAWISVAAPYIYIYTRRDYAARLHA